MDIARILARFPGVPPDAADRAVTSSDGLINTTWLIDDTFVLQRVNPLFGPGVNEDIDALTKTLVAAGVPVPRLKLADDGRPFVEDEGVWRLMTRLPGRTYHRIEHPEQAYNAAQLIARFHAVLTGSTHRFAFSRPGAHDTPRHMARLASAVTEHRDHRLVAQIAPIAEEITARWEALPEAKALPERIIHGDLKISNVLFDEAHEAVGLIDLDTMAYSDLEVELGDALRSWCSTTTEDALDPRLDVEIFEAALGGYFSESPTLAPSEKGAFVRGIERITLELAARFAADALHESYFGWSTSVAATRGEHNLIRATNQLRLAQQIAEKRESLETIARRVAR